MMWDGCGILKKMKTFSCMIPVCKCEMNVGFTRKVNFGFTFWYRNIDMSKLCVGWLVGEVDVATAVQLFRSTNFDLIFQI